jgi:DNA topoisomerase-3
MNYKLIIAEKPSVGREIAKVLGANNKKDGYFEGNGYLVSWAIGHLIELAEPHHYDERLKEWSISTLPFIPDRFKYQVNKSTSQQFNVLKSLINRNDVISLINAGDCAREGQLIQELIFLVTGCKKPIERLWISSLTEKDIKNGFANLKPNSDYKGLTEAAHCRQQSDFLTGINGTRIFSLKASENNTGKREVFSLGRVQTPVLAIIVGREDEINNFTPTEYFQILGTFASNKGNYQGLWANNEGKNQVDEQAKANTIAAKVNGQTGIVEKVETKVVKEKPPLLFDLTSLQRVANNKYGFTAQDTLEIAQALYEAKYITYPRTSSQHLSNTIAQEIKSHLMGCNVAPYQQFVSQILGSQIRLTTRHINDSKISDHHALIPTTNQVDFSTLKDEEKKIYDLIARRFLAMFYPDAEIERTVITTNIVNEIFLTKGSRVLNPGWQVVEVPANSKTGKDKEEQAKAKSDNTTDEFDEEQANLPPVQEKQPVKTIKAEVLSKWTKAPPRYTDSSLLSTMEGAGREIDDEKLRQAIKDKGLGTPATRAGIIELLIEKAYVTREKKTFKPTTKGICLINLLPNQLLKSPQLTAEWEEKLIGIEKGNYSAAKFMDEVKVMVRQIVKDIANSDIGSQIADEMEESGENIPCGKCLAEGKKGVLTIIRSQKGSFLVCSLGKEKCGYLSAVPRNKKQAKALVSSRCPNCNGAMRLYQPKEKDKSAALFCIKEGCKGALWFNEKGSLNAPSANASNGNGSNANPKPTQETGQPCVKCGAPTVKRSFVSKQGKKGQFWSCSNWKREGGCDASPVWIN